MKKIIKRFSAAFLSLAVALTAVVFEVPGKTVAEAATVGGCDGTHTGKVWTGEAFDESGSYYLAGDVDLADQITIISGTDVILCLNGYTIDAQNSSRIFYINGGTLTLCDCGGNGKLTGGSSLRADNNSGYGGAVYIETGNFNMHGGTISNGTTSNNAARGGGVYMERGIFTMTGGTISENRVGSAGGGVCVRGGIFTMTGGTISYNEASPNNYGGAGGVYVEGGTFEMSGNSTISHNKGGSTGGVAVVGSNSKFIMSGNSIISYNEAMSNNGEGGVYVSSSIFTMNSGEIKNNTAKNGLGGVYLNFGTFTMNDGTISDNIAYRGGGVRMSGGTFEMNGGTISGNTVEKDGGGVAMYGGIFEMNDGTISGNNADQKGGGVYMDGGTFTMSGNSTISDNTASDGGGVYVDIYNMESVDYKFKMIGGTVSNNTATSEGGGVYLVGDDIFEDPFDGTEITPGGDLTINGKVDISGNKKGSSANNVYLADGKTITIGENFDTKSTIGVNTAATPTCTAFADVTGATTTDVSASFTADKNDQMIVYKDNKVQLSAKHKLSGSTTTDPTCTEPGKESGVCTECGEETFNITEPATGHDYGDWSVTKNPSLTATGTAKRTCENDSSHTETATVSKLSDTSVWTKQTDKHVESTEESTGKDVYTSEYGEVTVTLPKKEHTHKLTFVPEVPATETAEGVKEHWHCEGCGKNFSDKNGENEVVSDDLILGSIQIEVKSGENAPKAELATSKEELVGAVLTSEEQAVINDGEDVKITLTIEDATDKAPAEDKAAVESEISKHTDFTLGQYIDVNLLIKLGDKEQRKITEIKKPIKVTFEIPDELLGSGYIYSVIRVHDGETAVLPDLDDDENTVTVETDKFSIYALVYSKTTTSESGDSSDNTTSESTSEGGNDNPSTGVAVSLVPFAAAVTFLAVTVKRKKK